MRHFEYGEQFVSVPGSHLSVACVLSVVFFSIQLLVTLLYCCLVSPPFVKLGNKKENNLLI